MSTAFTGHEGRWQARLGKLRDVVRQDGRASWAASWDHRPWIIDLAAARGHRPCWPAGMR